MAGIPVDGAGSRPIPLTESEALESAKPKLPPSKTSVGASSPPPVSADTSESAAALGQPPALPAPKKLGVAADPNVSKPDFFDKLKAGWANLKADPRFQLAVKVFGVVAGAVALGMAIAATVAGGPIVPLVFAGISFAITAARHSGALEALFDKLGMSDQAKQRTMIVLGLVMLCSGTTGAISHLANAAHGVAAGAAVLDSGRIASGVKGAYDTGNRQVQAKVTQRDLEDVATELVTIADRSFQSIDAAGRQALADHQRQVAQVQGGSGALAV